MARHLYLNGENLQESSNSDVLLNSAFYWGMSVFTTGKIHSLGLPFARSHQARLEKGVKWLFNSDFSGETFLSDLKKAMSEVSLDGDFKFRYTIFEEVESGKLKRLLELSPYETVTIDSITSYEFSITLNNKTENIKVGNYSDVFRAKRRVGSELFLYNSEGYFTEASIANVLLGKEGKWFCPQGDIGLLKGIALTKGLKGFDVEEKKIHKNEAKEYDSLVLLNALHGPRLVQTWDERKLDQPCIESMVGCFKENGEADIVSLV